MLKIRDDIERWGIQLMKLKKSRTYILMNLKEDLKLKEGESLDDLCLKVNLKTKLPPPLTLPSDYNDVRVFYDVIGEITAR